MHPPTAPVCGLPRCNSPPLYKCPACLLPYCSLPCYRNHSAQCLADFHAQSTNHLQGKNVSDLQKKQFQSILRDHHHRQNDSEQHPIVEALETLVHQIHTHNLTYAQILSRLPPPLRTRFSQQLRDGTLASSIVPCTPWWHSATTHPTTTHPTTTHPALPTAAQYLVPPRIALRKASPSLAFGLLDILAAYAFTLRIANGDFEDDDLAHATLLSASSVLDHDRRHASATHAVLHILTALTQQQEHQFAFQCVIDTTDILSGQSDWVTRALFHCQTLLENGARKTRHVTAAIRKVAFYMAWAACQPGPFYDNLSVDVLHCAQRQSQFGEELRRAARIVPKNPAITHLASP